MLNFLLVFLKAWLRIFNFIAHFFCILYFKASGISFERGLKTNGIPYVSNQGAFRIGENFKTNNTINSNPIGRQYQCQFIVRKGGKLSIGNNVGISGTTIVCHKQIDIGDFVKIGGNVCIYDTDFHSLKQELRAIPEEDISFTKSSRVVIGNNVFIGAHSTILKGVTIGDNSVIGACSLVTQDIPPNEIWRGNPASFFRKLL